MRMAKHLVAFCALLSASTSSAAERVVRDETLILALGGHEVGTTRIRDVKTDSGYRLERKNDIRIERGASTIEIESNSVAHVDNGFRPVSFVYEKIDATGTLRITGKLEGDVINVVTDHGGAPIKSQVAMAEGLMFASAADTWLRTNLAALNNRPALKRDVLVEETGELSDMTARVKRAKDVYGLEITLLGIKTIERVDLNGRTLLSKSPALAAAAYPVGLAPPRGIKGSAINLLDRSTWDAPELPRPVSRVRFRIHTPSAASFEVPEDGRQRVVNRTATTVDVMVNAGPVDRRRLDAARREFMLRKTAYEPIDDVDIVNTAKRVTQGAKTDHERVKRLVDFVYNHIEAKTLDRGYAPAHRTLDEKVGDCTEHSVLLSALAKSIGIPARLADGVLVAGGRSGYHEWVELVVDDKGILAADPTFGVFPAGPDRLKLAEGDTSPGGLVRLGVAAGRILQPGVRIEVVDYAAGR